MKILLPVDGSVFTRHMLAWLATHEPWWGAGHDYTVVHVAPPLPPRAARALPRSVVREFHAEQSAKVFKPVRTFFARHGMPAEFKAKVGPAGVTLAALADAGRFELVIMGSHGHGPLGSLVLGSVAAQVLAHCKVPVLLVR